MQSDIYAFYQQCLSKKVKIEKVNLDKNLTVSAGLLPPDYVQELANFGGDKLKEASKEVLNNFVVYLFLKSQDANTAEVAIRNRISKLGESIQFQTGMTRALLQYCYQTCNYLIIHKELSFLYSSEKQANSWFSLESIPLIVQKKTTRFFKRNLTALVAQYLPIREVDVVLKSDNWDGIHLWRIPNSWPTERTNILADEEIINFARNFYFITDSSSLTQSSLLPELYNKFYLTFLTNFPNASGEFVLKSIMLKDYMLIEKNLAALQDISFASLAELRSDELEKLFMKFSPFIKLLIAIKDEQVQEVIRLLQEPTGLVYEEDDPFNDSSFIEGAEQVETQEIQKTEINRYQFNFNTEDQDPFEQSPDVEFK